MKHIFVGQPKGLYRLFFTELWERFGFYTVQTILVLYMSQGLHYGDQRAYLLYGAFSSMLFLTPVIGGYLADRFMGFRRTILWGALFFMAGYGIMAIPGEKFLFLGMAIVIVGNGLFKPNVSSIVGDLYAPGDPRRDGGFTLFYMGINIGGLLPPLFVGALVAAYSWGSGFFLAALGMVVALCTFLPAKKTLQAADVGRMPQHSPLHRGPAYRTKFYSLLVAGIIATVVVLQLLFMHPDKANIILITASVLVIGYVLVKMFKEPLVQRHKLLACLILIVISMGFWAVYVQTFTSMMLFASRNMSKEFLGFTINAEFTQFFNPFFIILLSPFLSNLWVKLEEKKCNPNIPTKFSIAILFMAFGYLLLGVGARWFSPDGITSPWWLVATYLSQTLGELFISPIGLSMVTRLAPRHLTGLMMGVWFLTYAAAFAIGGSLATLADVPKGTPSLVSLPIYTHAFFVYGGLSLVLAAVSFLLAPYLQRLIHPREPA